MYRAVIFDVMPDHYAIVFGDKRAIVDLDLNSLWLECLIIFRTEEEILKFI